MKCFFLGVSLCLVVLVSACSGAGSKPDAAESGTATPGSSEATPEPTATAPTTPTPMFNARDLVRTEPVPFPAGVVMYATDAVWEGPTAALRRYYRNAAGQFVSEPLLESVFAQGSPTSRAIVGVEFGGPGEVGVALCHGSCYGGPEPVTIARSDDGGVTWHDILELEAGGWGSLVAIEGDTTIIRGPSAAEWWPFENVTTSSRTPLPLPVGVPPTAGSLRIVGGGLHVALYSEDRRTIVDLLTGMPIVTLPVAWDAKHYEAALTDRPGGESVAVLLFDASSANREGYLAFLDTANNNATDIYRWREADGLNGVIVLGWLSPTLAIGRADFDQADYVPGTVSFFHGIPALIDLEKGTVSPIAEFLPQLTGKAGGPFPQFVETGGFAIIKTGGDCLNVRQSPVLTAPVLGCYADRVILPLGGAEPSGGWIPVHTPDGRQGWAAAEFLEQVP